ncbi:MAG: RadC family protein [Sphingomonadaceae bacterium]
MASEAVEYSLGVKEMLPEDRPRERLATLGAASLSNHELLAILIGSGTSKLNVLQVAQTLLRQFGGLAGLARASTEDLCLVPGIGPVRAVELKACLELGRRLLTAPDLDRPAIRCPADAAHLVMDMGLLEQEHLKVLLLNTKNHVLGLHEVYKGSLNSSLIRVGELFKEAIRQNCAAIIVVHNHPSGDPSPSRDDIQVTRQAVEAGKLLDVELLDHLIIGRGDRWISLKEKGLGFN